MSSPNATAAPWFDNFELRSFETQWRSHQRAIFKNRAGRSGQARAAATARVSAVARDVAPRRAAA